MSDSATVLAPEPNARVLRRLGAMLYDSLVIIALEMVATALLLALSGGEAITPERYGGGAYLYRAVLIAVIVAFFGWFWTRRGQTLGMMAWRLKVVRDDGTLLSWADVLKRLAGALVSGLALGLGYFWIWIDREHLAWHDRWSCTRVIVLPKRS